LTKVDIEERGVRGDRLYAVRSAGGKIGSGKSTRRFKRMTGLFSLRASYETVVGSRPSICGPDGQLVGDDAALREFLGRPDIRLAREADVMHFDAAPLHLITTATIGSIAASLPAVPIDERRFRPNIVLDTVPASGFVEDDWVNRTGRIGPAVQIAFSRKTGRCGMTMMAQDELPHSSDVLRTIIAVNDMNAGVYATVVTPGTVRVGDELTFLD
jgi:uncharacterized protein YcbX